VSQTYPFAAQLLALVSETTALSQAYDPTQPIKAWSATASQVPPGTLYPYLDPANAAGGYISYQMAPSDPAATNNPGFYNAPQYVIPSCVVQEAGPSGVSFPDIGPSVCSPALAQYFLNTFQALYPDKKLGLLQFTPPAPFSYVYPDDRRMFMLTGLTPQALNIQQFFVGPMNAAGVGLPGSWQDSKSNPGYPVWVSTPQVTSAPSGAVTLPVPCRALLPGEQIQNVVASTPFGTSGLFVFDNAATIQFLQAKVLADQQQLAADQAALAQAQAAAGS
jgi:hypothetical protein